MNEYELDQRIDAANAKMVSDEAMPENPIIIQSQPLIRPQGSTESPLPQPIDVYQLYANASYDESKKQRPHGSSALVTAVTEDVVNGSGGYEGLARAYKRMKRDCDLLRERGEDSRAELIKQQYMMDSFLPAIEVVVNSASPDELLNCSAALDALDQFAPTVGGGKGFTAGYVKQAYGDTLGQRPMGSDGYITDAVIKINRWLDDGSNRMACSLANKIKKQIDNGEHIASDEDYELISRVVNAM